MPETASTLFNLMLKDLVAPVLRSLGFKGSGTKYRLDRDEYKIGIEFQRSKRRTTELLPFDVNLSIAHRPTLELFEEANEKARELGKEIETPTSGAYWGRLSSLDSERPEFGWNVNVNEPIEPVADDVIAAIRSLFLPKVEEELRKPPSFPTPAALRRDRPSQSQRNEAALSWHLDALRESGVG